ncbi:MAG: alpha/beta hydrolase [Oscillospiraceae bacterium]
MIMKKIDMSVDYEKMGVTPPIEKASLLTYILDAEPLHSSIWNKRPAVIVCMGGGYEFKSEREGEPVVLKYCAAGCHGFLLDYSVSPTGWPAATCELAKAIAYVRSIADEYDIDSERVYVCGFSAGGHLAASSGVYWDNDLVHKFSQTKNNENRPDGMILGYPVISKKDSITHGTTRNVFVDGKPENLDIFALDENVTQSTPKTFLWHTFEDNCVPVENSMDFGMALLKNRVPFEMHIFPKGGHGLSLANPITSTDETQNIPANQPWIDLSIEWLKG